MDPSELVAGHYMSFPVTFLFDPFIPLSIRFKRQGPIKVKCASSFSTGMPTQYLESIKDSLEIERKKAATPGKQEPMPLPVVPID